MKRKVKNNEEAKRVKYDPEGIKYDGGKNPLDLLPFDALATVGLVLEHGAKKYGRRNWEKGMSWSRLFGATLRHLFAFGLGDYYDKDSKLPHLAHAACCILFLLSYSLRNIGEDDIGI